MLKKVSRKNCRRLAGIPQPAQLAAPGVFSSFDLVAMGSLIAIRVPHPLAYVPRP
jgi:hypothetical protein